MGLERNAICDNNATGGFEGNSPDTTISVFAVLLSWLSLPFLMHTLLHTFVWGWPGRESDEPLETSLQELYYAHNSHSRGVHDRQRDVKFYLHLPSCYQFFYNNGGVGAYIACCYKKLALLIKMTLGVWDLELTRNFEVLSLAKKYDDDPYDNETNHEEILCSLGKSRSLLWQFLPLGVWVAKFAEANNDVPVWCNAERADVEEDELKRRKFHQGFCKVDFLRHIVSGCVDILLASCIRLYFSCILQSIILCALTKVLGTFLHVSSSPQHGSARAVLVLDLEHGRISYVGLPGCRTVRNPSLLFLGFGHHWSHKGLR